MQPLKFIPLIKRARWGGTRLGEVLHKPIGALIDAAESWELCDHGSDQTVVAQGPYSGWTLQRLVREKPAELFGRQVGQSGFPLLLKFLDVQDRISLQVHPTDTQAQEFVTGDRGKTEAWIIVTAEPNSYVFAGLAHGMTESQLREELQSGNVEQCLQKLFVRTGDVLFIPAGMVHALGPGLLVAEVQQSSVRTFRLWDWNKVDADGNLRELHVERALACTNFARRLGHVEQPQALHCSPAYCEELLVESAWFVIHRHKSTEPFRLLRDNQFRALMVLDGQATLHCDGEETSLILGETVLVPAAAAECMVVPGDAVTLLDVFLP